MNYKEKCDSTPPNKESKQKPYNIPVTTGRTFECPRTPDIYERNVPTLQNYTSTKGPPNRKKSY